MCEKYLYGSEGGAGNDRPYPYLRGQEMPRSSAARHSRNQIFTAETPRDS